MGESNSKFREKITKSAKSAKKLFKNAGDTALVAGKQIEETFRYTNLNDIISDPLERYNFIQTLKNNQIDPSSVIISVYNNLTKTISFSLSHRTSKNGRIQSVPSYYTYSIKTKQLTDEYQKSLLAQEEDKEALR